MDGKKYHESSSSQIRGIHNERLVSGVVRKLHGVNDLVDVAIEGERQILLSIENTVACVQWINVQYSWNMSVLHVVISGLWFCAILFKMSFAEKHSTRHKMPLQVYNESRL